MALSDGLQRYYPLDGNADDVHGGADAAITGTPTWEAGHVSAQALNLGATPNTCRADPFISTDVSLQMWMYRLGSGGTFYGVVGNMRSGAVTDNWFMLGGGADTGVIYSNGNSSTTIANPGAPFPLNDWCHVVYTHGPSGRRLYIDGVLASSDGAGTPPAVVSAVDFLIGCRNDGYGNWPARLQEVALWDRALDASEVAELYNGGDGLSYADIVGPPGPTPEPSKLMINGINLGAIMAAAEEPKVTWRDIGETTTAVDGTTNLTRSARKVDTSFRSVPITQADAHSWRCLLSGEGECWSFDSHLYGSKGTPATSITNASQSAGSSKYGAGKLSVGATTGTISFASAINSWGNTSSWTVGVWRFESGAWHHYVILSSGAKWVDGVRNDAAVTTWLSVAAGVVTIANTTGSAVLYDDLVVLPFLALADWPAQWFAAGRAFGALPIHAATGSLVDEQSVRSVLGTAEEGAVMRVSGGLRVKLEVELRAR